MIKKDWTEKMHKEVAELTSLHIKKITKVHKVDPRGEKISEIIFPARGDKPFGCRSTYVAAIFSHYAGYDIPVKDSSYDVAGSMITILKHNDTNHHYPANEPVLFIDTRVGFVQTRNGAMKDPGGIHFDKTNYNKTWRFSTPKEIAFFFSAPKLSTYGGWKLESVILKFESRYASIRATLDSKK